MEGPCDIPARLLARRLRQRRLSAVEALEAHLERIEKHNATLNAVVSLDVDGARKAARKADTALGRGERRTMQALAETRLSRSQAVGGASAPTT